MLLKHLGTSVEEESKKLSAYQTKRTLQFNKALTRLDNKTKTWMKKQKNKDDITSYKRKAMRHISKACEMIKKIIPLGGHINLNEAYTLFEQLLPTQKTSNEIEKIITELLENVKNIDFYKNNIDYKTDYLKKCFWKGWDPISSIFIPLWRCSSLEQSVFAYLYFSELHPRIFGNFFLKKGKNETMVINNRLLQDVLNVTKTSPIKWQ